MAAALTPASSDLNDQITKQGDLVRSLKAAKAEKTKVDEAVKVLLELKAKYKTATGQVSDLLISLNTYEFFRSYKQSTLIMTKIKSLLQKRDKLPQNNTDTETLDLYILHML